MALSSSRHVTGMKSLLPLSCKRNLHAFKVADRRRIEEIREVITTIEERVNILRRSRDNAWEFISDRLTTEVERVSATLDERVAEVERVVQTRSASPATSVEQNPALHGDIARLDSRIGTGFKPSLVK